ncbi:MAG: NTP transferase domain-containing protein [Verrucomicrobiae bacterium]|nr:NTP transferase domain-containing protein [Verrucomicrobiae bacterium]
MKAVILAAGRGTRMKHLTEELPKPMIPVRGKPILERILQGLSSQAGVREFFILVGYRADVIQNYFGNGQSQGWNITYGKQIVQDGTGRAVNYAKEWIGKDRFFLSYGDILITPQEYANCAQAFTEDGLITVKKMSDTSQGGAVVFDENFYLKKIVEKSALPTPSSWYNTGFYGFTSEIFHYIDQLKKSPRGEYELTDALNNMAQNGLKIKGFELTSFWADVRDPEILEQLNQSADWYE